jgi:peptidoglycan/LPS O-acetylase OafA/YrhL
MFVYAPNVNWGYLGYIRLLSHNFGFAPSVALILFCAARYDTLFSRFLNSRPLVAFGEASYSIYLVSAVSKTRAKAGSILGAGTPILILDEG